MLLRPLLRPLLLAATLVASGTVWITTLRADDVAPRDRGPVSAEVLADLRALPRTPQRGVSVGPDVTIINLSGFSNYTASSASQCPPGYGVGGEDCRGYSLGTDSCNVGSVPVDWCDQVGGCRTTTDEYHPLAPATVSDHSVISQNLYRLKDGRFQQIGLSFLKHGFLSLNSPSSSCEWNDGGIPSSSCVQPPAGGQQLGVGCTDFYGSGLNGSRPMGRRSDVVAANGDHPPSGAGGETDDSYDQRMVVAESDLDPAQNPGALYWGEGQYVVRDDARAGNGLNNASHRQVTVGSLPRLDLFFTGPTVRELPAIYAWQAVDPEVEIVAVDRATFFVGEEADPPIPPGTFYPDHTVVERFHAARRLTEEPGRAITPYHLEYVVHNLNSTTAADGFVVHFPDGTNVEDVGFSDIPHHSGEPYDTSDWTISVDSNRGVTVRWSAVDVGSDTNALRWGTSFNFWLDADRQPTAHSLDLFEIDEQLSVPFGPLAETLIFGDDLESGDLTGWSSF